ncbi:MAG TPA: hypothetical protein VHS32_27380, partial [Streptosporangiaceae bacterium]|nr:hypothetical protein [Streptosporangiaceae bacterium]
MAASTVAMKSCRATGSSIATGSSSTSSRGRRASASVSASCACCPPDSLPAFRRRQADRQVQQRGLARTVRADQRGHVTGGN